MFQCLVANGRRRRRLFCLVANGRRRKRLFCLVANGRKKKKLFCLVANGRRRRRFFLLGGQWKEKEKVLFHLFPLSPQATLLKPSFFFLLILRFYFTMVLGHYLRISSLFPWPINYDHIFWCHKSPTHSLPIRFGWRSLLFSLKLWHCVWSRVMGLKLRKWMKSRPRNHL